MENREETFERIVRKITRSASDCKSFAYELQLRDRHGIVLDTIKGSTKTSGSTVTDQVAKLEADLRASFTDFPLTYSIAGNYGQVSPVASRITINDILPLEDSQEEEMMPAPILQDKRVVQHQIQQQQAVVDANHDIANTENTTENAMNLLQAFGDTFGVHGLGDINTPEGKQMSFMLQLQANKLRDDAEKKEFLGTIDVQKSQLSELNAEIRLLKEQISKNEKLIKEQSDKIDRMAKKIDSDKDKLKDYEKMKTKNGRVAAVAGQALGQMLAGFASKTRYAGLLGLWDDDEEEMENQDESFSQNPIPQPIQQVDGSNNNVIELD